MCAFSSYSLSRVVYLSTTIASSLVNLYLFLCPFCPDIKLRGILFLFLLKRGVNDCICYKAKILFTGSTKGRYCKRCFPDTKLNYIQKIIKTQHSTQEITLCSFPVQQYSQLKHVIMEIKKLYSTY